MLAGMTISPGLAQGCPEEYAYPYRTLNGNVRCSLLTVTDHRSPVTDRSQERVLLPCVHGLLIDTGNDELRQQQLLTSTTLALAIRPPGLCFETLFGLLTEALRPKVSATGAKPIPDAPSRAWLGKTCSISSTSSSSANRKARPGIKTRAEQCGEYSLRKYDRVSWQRKR